MQRHHLMCDRRWMCWDPGPCGPKGEFRFQVYQPAKLAEPLMVADKPWEAMSNGWHTLIRDQGRYRCWYEAWDETYKHDCEGRLCYAESDDGLLWRKPELGLVEWRGSKQNNILIDGATAFYGFGFHGSSVFVDPTADPAERYKLIYLGVGRSHFGEGLICVMMQAYSADGLKWQARRHPCWGGPPTLLGYASDTQTVAFWDRSIRKYVGFFRSWEPGYGRCIARSETNDFFNWPAPTIVRCDEHDGLGVDIYNNAANRYESGDDAAYFFFMSMFDHDSDTLNVQLATSRDGYLWSRSDRSPFIRNGPGRFDRGGIYTAPSILPFRDGLAVPYHGVSYKHGEAVPDKIRYEGALGMVTLPRDRFIGVRADGEYEFCLQHFQITSDRLEVTVNSLSDEGGEVRVALSADGSVRPGMSFAECRPITGDQPAGKAVWTPGADLRPLIGKWGILRFLVKKATLFAVTVDHPGS